MPADVRGRAVPATVPGCVHTDLLAAGLIADPYVDANEGSQHWIGLTSWRYETVLEHRPGAQRVELCLDGVDTIAEITVDGRPIGATRNMHRRYRFDITDVLRPGPNPLRIDLAAPIPAAERSSEELGPRPAAYPHPYNAIRKMACSFGWDWGPDTASSGIWRRAAIEEWSIARLAEIRPIARIAGDGGTVEVHVEIARTGDEELDLVASVGGGEARRRLAPGETSTVLAIDLARVDPWWPAGYGDQPLSELEVRLEHAGHVLDRADRRVGFRTVVADTAPDGDGIPFTLRVNGVDVFVRGANWIPDDAFPHRVTGERLRRRLDQAREANVNLLRVWGGGVYESDEFYAECDERGILVWQDFLAACALYSEDEPLATEFEAEARDNVARLAHHPALVVLNGNNECLWGAEEWWPAESAERAWGATYYHDVFPRIVAELAPTVIYTPGSPFSPDPAHAANDPRFGTSHLWDVRQHDDYLPYREHRPRFVAEFGWQGPPTFATLTEFVSGDPLGPESPNLRAHQKSGADGNRRLTELLAAHFPEPAGLDDWLWATSLNQAAAIRYAVDHFRSLRPLCAGVVVWQLNDCWPAVSWSAIDGQGRPKPLFYALRHAYADRVVTVQPRDVLSAVVANDTDEDWAGILRLSRRRFDGAVLAEVAARITVPRRTTLTVPFDASTADPGDPAAEYLRAELGGSVARWYFVPYRDSRLRAPRLDARLDREGRRYRLSVTADALVRDLALFVDRVDPGAVVDDMLVTIDAGEVAVFSFDSDREIALDELTDARVLRSANDLVAGDRPQP